ncbi:hypothetical protein UYSO10_1645 [Kosakonia radicincitans]|nr:hypothetical protein UYSO10_1645 [Kosakonia radicincitans]
MASSVLLNMLEGDSVCLTDLAQRTSAETLTNKNVPERV